uniref:Uncharacterized protein n=1 Tax=Amanita thiersii TaxID=235537 RepID=A0A5Q0N2Z0_9AGAR|nr:hypothetical protein [Amanita thiersii]QFZ98711.1 hypothetical protein [Amanita thiersii]
MVYTNSNYNYNYNSIPNNHVGAQDPVIRIPSSFWVHFGIIGSAVYAYNRVAGPLKIKLIAGLAALGVSAGTTFHVMATENPVGLNSYMYSLTESLRTGRWQNLTGRMDPNHIEIKKILKN